MAFTLYFIRLNFRTLLHSICAVTEFVISLVASLCVCVCVCVCACARVCVYPYSSCSTCVILNLCIGC